MRKTVLTLLVCVGCAHETEWKPPELTRKEASPEPVLVRLAGDTGRAFNAAYRWAVDKQFRVETSNADARALVVSGLFVDEEAGRFITELRYHTVDTLSESQRAIMYREHPELWQRAVAHRLLTLSITMADGAVRIVPSCNIWVDGDPLFKPQPCRGLIEADVSMMASLAKAVVGPVLPVNEPAHPGTVSGI